VLDGCREAAVSLAAAAVTKLSAGAAQYTIIGHEQRADMPRAFALGIEFTCRLADGLVLQPSTMSASTSRA